MARAAGRLFGFGTTTVFDGSIGLEFRDGRIRGTLGPGRYLTWSGRVISVFSVRLQILVVGGQEVSTQDGFQVRATATVTFRIEDPLVLWQVQGPQWLEALRLSAQLALRGLAASRGVDALMGEARETLDAELLKNVNATPAATGLAISALSLRDLVLPAELRRMLTGAEIARREGLAALERARGEQAALRALANAARLLRNNPELQNLRLLQTLAGEKGSRPGTVIFGGTGLVPLRPGETDGSLPE